MRCLHYQLSDVVQQFEIRVGQAVTLGIEWNFERHLNVMTIISVLNASPNENRKTGQLRQRPMLDVADNARAKLCHSVLR